VCAPFAFTDRNAAGDRTPPVISRAARFSLDPTVDVLLCRAGVGDQPLKHIG